MTIQAWTFLVSRNQSIDYKTVVAPDFISQAKIRSLITKATEEDFVENEHIFFREVKGSEVGDLTIIFRSVKARKKDMGGQGDDILKDPFGREIYWIEGFVFREGIQNLWSKIGDRHLDQAHRELQGKYSEFWYGDKLNISHAIQLPDVISKSSDNFRLIEPLVITSKPQLQENLVLDKRYDKYPSSQSLAIKPSLIRFLLIAATVLLLTSMLGIRFRGQAASICFYTIQEQQIDFDPAKQDQLSGFENLKALDEKHKQAWIWVNGSLTVDSSLVEAIKRAVENQGGSIGERTVSVDESEQNTIILKNHPERTVSVDESKQNTIILKNHPTDSLVDLLSGKEILSGTLDVTILEPISQSNAAVAACSHELSLRHDQK